MRKKQDIILWAIIILSLISIIPFFMLARYGHPSADDYAYSFTTYEVWRSTRNLFSVIKEAAATSIRYWHKWQGLYTSAFLLALQPGLFGEQYYAATGFIILGMLCISNLIFSYYILHRCLKERTLLSVSMGMLLSSLMLNWFPSLEEGVYWYNGAMNYTFFMGILLFVFCILIDLCREQPKRNVILKIIIGSILAVLLSGGNHVTAFSGLLLTIGILIFQLLRKRTAYGIRVCVVLSLQTAGLCISLLSPGTSARQSALGGSKGLFQSIWRSVLYIMGRFERWTGLALIVCMIILIPFFWQSVKRIREQSGFTFPYPLLVFMGSVAFLAAMMFPPYYAMGSHGSERIINMPYMAFIILVFVNEYYICGWLRGKLYGMEATWSLSWMAATALLLCGMIMGCYDTTIGYEALECVRSGEAGLYSQEADARYNLLIQSKGQDLEVPAYSVYPRLLFARESDITEDKDYYKNQHVATFYGLNSIAIKQE